MTILLIAIGLFAAFYFGLPQVILGGLIAVSAVLGTIVIGFLAFITKIVRGLTRVFKR
jgi:hypothetical protein